MSSQSPSFAAPRLAGLALVALAAGAQAEDDPRLAQSRDIVAAFGNALKSELMQAMSRGGPAAAIDVCKDVAPGVASRLSRQHGAKVSRTSLRQRNPANLPSRWQSKVLHEFDERAEAGEEGPLEYSATTRNGRFRYMKAIPTAGLCLGCHGSDLPGDVQKRLDEEYPHDRARGYAAGEIRGAFSVVWPATEDD